MSLPVSGPVSPLLHSELEPVLSTAGGLTAPQLRRSEAAALRSFSNTVAALAAGYLLTGEVQYAEQANLWLKPWLLAPESRLQPVFDAVGCAPGKDTATPAGVVDLVPLAELTRALSFLTDALAPGDLEAIQAWCTEAARWLDTNRQALIARDTKDHRASAHLLVASALARFRRDETTLEDCRKRFRTHALRNQIRNDGVFPQEVATPNPYRNTLFNLDLLAGACQLLSSQFDLLWIYELVDGVGMRTVAAYLYPVVSQPEKWGYPADARFFRDLPGRRPGMLFCGRAFNRPEYVAAWQQRPPSIPEGLSESFPIRQPALWTARAPHGL